MFCQAAFDQWFATIMQHLPQLTKLQATVLALWSLDMVLALVPLPRVHLVRYGGCLAPHSQLRGSITPTPRQQGAEAPAASASPRWGWARLLKRVFAFDMERCPACGRGTLRVGAMKNVL